MFNSVLFNYGNFICLLQSDSLAEEGIHMRQLSVDTILAPLGEIKYSISYCRSTRQCTVTILKAENLMQTHKDCDCNSFVKVYLFSDQIKKEQTDVVRGTRHPAFNCSFLFTDVDMSNTKIRLRVFNKTGSTVSISSKRSVLGEVNIDSVEAEAAGESQWSELLEPETVC